MQEVNDDLQEHLKNLMEASPLYWTYAIMWRYNPFHPGLRFYNGYYKGMGEVKEIRILGSSVSVTEEVTHSQSDWFFKISKAQTFMIHECLDLPGHAFWKSESLVWVNAADMNVNSTSSKEERHEWGTWERTKWGHQHGIQTFLCIPLKELSVFELASTEIIPCHPEWVKEMAAFINPTGTLSPQILKPPAPKEFWNKESLLERADDEMQNCGNNNLSKLFRGKEKINDSKSSWSLLTESSDRGTDRTFSHDYSGPSEFWFLTFILLITKIINDRKHTTSFNIGNVEYLTVLYRARGENFNCFGKAMLMNRRPCVIGSHIYNLT